MNCKICSEPYKVQDPKKMPRVLTQCGHTFCSQCIQKNLNFNRQLFCQDCGKMNFPPQNNSFPLNETLVSILQKNGKGLCEFKETQICKFHGKKLQAFCENDQTSLCLSCILNEHKNHKIFSINQKVQKQKGALKNCEQSILKSQQRLIKKQQECKRLIGRLELDFNEYVFEINLLYKNIMSQLKESEERFISQTKKNIERSIKNVQVTEEKVRQKIQFYTQLIKIYQEIKSKSDIQFLNETNKRLFIVQNCSVKQSFELFYKKEEIHRQKILNDSIKSLQEFVAFQKKKNVVYIDKKQSSNKKISQDQSQGFSYQQGNNLEKGLKSHAKEESFSKNFNQSPCKMQKKGVGSAQKVTKEPQILQVNLLQKYEKHMQSKNMKKRNSEMKVAKGKSPRIQYEIKRQVQMDMTHKNSNNFNSKSKYNSNQNFKQKGHFDGAQKNSQNKSSYSEMRSIVYNNNLQQSKTQDFQLSFFNESEIVLSPERVRNQKQIFEIQTPLSINSFMESSQCTVFQQKKDQTMLKNSGSSFTMFCQEDKVYHFGGLKNMSVNCQKITNSNNQLRLTDQKSLKGFVRSKAQCLILKIHHPKKCLILGGKDQNGERSKTFFSYDFQTNIIQKCMFQLNEPISGFGAVVNNDKIYVFGGSSFSALKNLHEYRVTKNKCEVKKLNPMMNSRDQLGFALGFDGHLYVAGGINSSNTILNSCEKYNFNTNKWSSIAAMRTPRRSFTLLSLPNGLYAIGGHDGKSFLNSVQMYDFDLQNWVEVSQMNEARFAHTAVCTSDYQNIIVFGGFQNQPMKSVQVYNIIDNNWYVSNSMEKEKYLHCSILVQE